MNYYSTPIKQSPQAAHIRSTKSNQQNKMQDWVCILCNNLNFSFRKKCNRCKTQTRIQNQNHIASTYSHYYYDHHQYSCSNVKSALSDVTNLYTPEHQNQEQAGSNTKYRELENMDPQTHRKPQKQEKGLVLSLSLNLNVNPPKKQQKTCLPQKNILEPPSVECQKKQSYINQFWELINVRDFDDIIAEDGNDGNNEEGENNQESLDNEEECSARNQERRISADLERMFDKILLQ